jgi:hypothetical protein
VGYAGASYIFPQLYPCLRVSSDSPRACGCKIGAQCHCSESHNRAPRKPKPKTSPTETTQPSTASSSSSSSAPLTPTVDLTKHHFRPVLPRPSHSSGGPVHDPSSVKNPHPHPRHAMLYSPYGRAYEHLGTEVPAHPGLRLDPQMAIPSPDAPPTHIAHEQPFAPPQTPTGATGPFVWPVPPSALPNGDPLSEVACGCGPNCACPGCAEHAGAGVFGPPTPQAWAMCADPVACTACLQCAIMSMPPQGTGSQGRVVDLDGANITEAGAEDYGAIDEWIRQVEAHVQQPFDLGQAMQAFQQQGNQVPAGTRHDQARPFDPEATPLPQQQWLFPQDYEQQGYTLPYDATLGPGSVSTMPACCVGPCRCPHDECACLPKQCACKSDPENTASSQLGVTFATSAERPSHCGGRLDRVMTSGTPETQQPYDFSQAYGSSHEQPLPEPAFPAGLTGYGRLDEQPDGYFLVTSSDGSSSPRSPGPSSRRSSYSAAHPFPGGLAPLSALQGRPRSGSAVSTGQASSVAASMGSYDFGEMQLR